MSDTYHTDENQPDIVRALRKAGAFVQSLAQVGSGCPDLLVGFRGRWVMMEVVGAKKFANNRKTGGLSAGQVAWQEEAARRNLPHFVIRTVDEALEAIGATQT